MKQDNLGPKLNSQFLNCSHDSKRIESFLSNPVVRAKIAEGQKELIRQQLQQKYNSDVSTVKVTRNLETVKIEWDLAKDIPDFDKYIVEISAMEIAFDPYESPITGGILHKGIGSGYIEIDLEIGVNFHFQIEFLSPTYFESEMDNCERCRTVNFLVGIPLSEQKKELMRRSSFLEGNPADSVRHELETKLSIHDSIDDIVTLAIERINQKEISQKEKKERIADFREYANALREKYE